MTAAELCIRRVITADPDETVVAAARRMAEENVGDLVVVQRLTAGVTPIGIVTDRDLVLGALAIGTPAALARRVADVMTPAITARDTDGIDQVLHTLRTYKIRRLPIVDDAGTLIGLITLDDLVAWIREQLDDAADVIEHQGELAALASR